jgi:hypothetical protein
LAALRAGDDASQQRLERALTALSAKPSAPYVLRDVQYALAVEHGFDGWVALQQQYLRNAAAASETLAHYEEKAAALLDAYRTGRPDAMERHWRLTWHRRAWPAMRTYVQIGLGYPASDDREITLDDARWLVAREHAFEDWSALRRVVSVSTRTPDATTTLLSKPMALLGASVHSTTREPEVIAISRAWPEILAESRDIEATGLDAHGQMTDALLRDLPTLPHLTTLRLNGSAGVTDEGVALLVQLPHLEHLDLSGTSVTDRGVARLHGLTHLRSLSLAWTRTTDAGTASLGALHRLESIDLSGTACGDASIRAFVGLPHLRRFSSGQGTTDAGLPLFHEYPVFASWHGGEPQMALLSYDNEPNRLQLRGAITDRGVARLKGLDGLFGLNLDDRSLGLSAAALAPLVDLAHLGWLAFDTDDAAMRVIAQMPRLRFLGCQDTECSDAGWAALGSSTSIEHIWGRRCYGLARNGFLALSRIPSLQHLSVSCRNVDDTALSALPSFAALRELMPMDVPDAGYRHIGRCTALDSLVLMYCRDTTDDATAHLTSLPNLRRYFASYTQITDRTPALLAQMESLEAVTFDSCAGLTDSGVAQLTRLPRLRELRVSGRRLTSAVKGAFSPGVMVHYSL